jgi:hypothetical protein
MQVPYMVKKSHQTIYTKIFLFFKINFFVIYLFNYKESFIKSLF